MGEEAYAIAVQAINNDIAAQKQKLAIKQAKLDKQNAIFNATLSTANAVLNILAKYGLTPISAGLIALTLGAMGAQIAAIKSAPIPGYEKGRDGGAEELAFVGERGREIVYGKNFAYLTPPTKTLTYLPAGASVLPAGDTKQILSNDYSELSDRLQRIESAIINKPETEFHITEKGIYMQVKRGQNKTKYINGIKG
jgi:hypothetical protein